MLKNAGDVLPLIDPALRVAVLGPLADASVEMRGPWWGAADPEGHVTVLAGLRDMLPENRVAHAAGVDIDSDEWGGVAAALALCESAAAVVLCVGEAASMSGEAASRAHLDLPGRQREFAEAVIGQARALRKPVIVVLFCGRPLIVPWLFEQADAVLVAWFLGSEAGHAIGDVILGHVSPSGRTPVTWARALGQVPIYFGQRPSGRPADPRDHFTSKYLDVANEPLFPFGHGLTYGRFAYSNLKVPEDGVTETDTVAIRVDVRNEGRAAPRRPSSCSRTTGSRSVARPVLELKGFGKIRLAPGESGTVTLLLPAAELEFLGADLAAGVRSRERSRCWWVRAPTAGNFSPAASS